MKTRMIRFLAATCVAAKALAGESVPIDITGVKLQNGLNQSRNSAPQTIDPDYGYEYDTSAMVKGNSGLLAILYPNPIDLGVLLDQFEPGASALLRGEMYNAHGTHPLAGPPQRFEGSAVLNGVPVTFGATFQAGIDVADIASFSATNVLISPAIIVGSMIVTSGTTTLTRMHVTAGDMNWDGSVNQFDIQGFVDALLDPAQYAATYGHDRVFGGDVNRDGTVNTFDITPFINLLLP